jgi:hypothetical protein
LRVIQVIQNFSKGFRRRGVTRVTLDNIHRIRWALWLRLGRRDVNIGVWISEWVCNRILRDILLTTNRLNRGRVHIYILPGGGSHSVNGTDNVHVLRSGTTTTTSRVEETSNWRGRSNYGIITGRYRGHNARRRVNNRGVN